MNFKLPKSPVFWVPMPDKGQSRMKLVEYRLTEGKQPETMQLTDPDTKLPYTVEILDWMGAYKPDEIPDWVARQTINRDATGAMYGQLLLKKVPEFKDCKKILFYQVNPINQTT
jgi:hypothetical protein